MSEVKNKKGATQKPRRHAPAKSADARESQLVSLATDLAEKQLLEGTATSQVITHYLKLGSSEGRVKHEIAQEEKKLLVAKTANIESAARVEELYDKAIKAMNTYKGNEDEDDV